MTDQTAISEQEDELVLRLWDGDESAKADLVMRYALPVERMVQARFPGLSAVDAEDAVCEAILKFWKWKDRYEPGPGRASIKTLLYRWAVRVVGEHRSGKYKWQKSKNLEEAIDPEWLGDIQVNEEAVEEDGVEESPKLHRAVKKALDNLDPLQQAILGAFRDALVGSHEVVAADLGVELGKLFKGGVPIPAGTMRVNKKRAIDRFVIEMKKLGFDLKEMGIINE